MVRNVLRLWVDKFDRHSFPPPGNPDRHGFLRKVDTQAKPEMFRGSLE